MLGKLFSRNRLKKPLSFESIGTDLHSHLIPGIDDGAKTIEESLFLIRRMHDMGIKHFITTPHIMQEFYMNTPEIILGGLEKLREAVQQAGIAVTIEAAAEYLIDGDFENKFRSGKLMTFGKNYLLLELSYFNCPHNLFQLLFDLQIEGYSIILAHPERYTYWHNNFRAYFELKDKGILFQLNTISLSGYYSRYTRDIAIRMCESGMIDFIGSDMHNNIYLEGLEKSLYEPHLKNLLESGKLLNSTL